MDGDGDIQPLRLIVERPELLIAEGLAHAHVRAVRGEHSAQHAQFRHAAPEFLHGFVHVLRGQEGNAYEPRIDLAVGCIEPVVVAAADRRCPERVLNHADAEAGGGVEDGVLQADLVEEALPGGLRL